MAYRFTDTGKWSDGWFVDLKPTEKLMFIYLCENCDIAGFIELSLRKLSFDLGLKPEEIRADLKGLEKTYILSQDKRVLFIRNFLKHQKNLPLKPQNNAHRGILSRFLHYEEKFIEDFFLMFKLNKEDITNPKNKGLREGYGNGNGKVLPLIKNNGIAFVNFWNVYDKKVGDKSKCEIAWDRLKIETQKYILETLPAWKLQFREKQYQPYPETYFNQSRWNDEVQAPNSVAGADPLKGITIAM